MDKNPDSEIESLSAVELISGVAAANVKFAHFHSEYDLLKTQLAQRSIG